jgi:hypothetical protein
MLGNCRDTVDGKGGSNNLKRGMDLDIGEQVIRCTKRQMWGLLVELNLFRNCREPVM